MKRFFDIVLTLLAIILLLPVFVIIVIAIRLTSKGPAIFEQQRAGKDGRPFVFYKFRPMKVDVDPLGASSKSGEDPRLTKVGRLLRGHLFSKRLLYIFLRKS